MQSVNYTIENNHEGYPLEYLTAKRDAILQEIERRKHIKVTYNQPIDATVIQALRETDIEDVANNMLGLGSERFAGALKFPCHLHGDGVDRHPSGVLYRDTNTWRCYVCNKGGDVISLVMTYKPCKFYEALDLLSKWTGLTVNSNYNINNNKKNIYNMGTKKGTITLNED